MPAVEACSHVLSDTVGSLSLPQFQNPSTTLSLVQAAPSSVCNISLIVASDIKGKRRPKFPEKIMEPGGKAQLKHACL